MTFDDDFIVGSHVQEYESYEEVWFPDWASKKCSWLFPCGADHGVLTARLPIWRLRTPKEVTTRVPFHDGVAQHNNEPLHRRLKAFLLGPPLHHRH